MFHSPLQLRALWKEGSAVSDLRMKQMCFLSAIKLMQDAQFPLGGTGFLSPCSPHMKYMRVTPSRSKLDLMKLALSALTALIAPLLPVLVLITILTPMMWTMTWSMMAHLMLKNLTLAKLLILTAVCTAMT
jgi:hypothetical protein